MAGEIEEPFRLDFKVDSFHSGSITFGRFETEALCWERRSSFSHNRYLEEVEKCSTPGLVTEKKAYFEARFRKKGILSLGSPESQNETERRTSDNDRSDSHMNVETCSPQFDESPKCSQHESECVITEQESGEFDSSNLDFQTELSSYNTNVDKSEVKEDPDDDAIRSESSNVSNVTIGVFCDSHAIEETSDTSRKGPHSSSNQEKVPPQAEPMKSRLVRRVSAAHSVRYSSNKEASKGSEKKPSKTVNKVLTRTRAEKMTAEASTQDKCSMNKTPKPEPGSKARGLNGIKRGEKERNRGVEAPQSTSWKLPSRARHSENRIKPAGGLTQPCIKQDSSRLSLKCNEHAERRKEFGMKIGEKIHAKETQMDELQENAQEKREAEIKQLRKSLNFKANPLPTFYHGVLRDSVRNKAVAGKIEPQKTKSSRASHRVSEGSKLSSKSNKGQTASISACPKTTDAPHASGGTSCHSTLTSDSSPSSPAAETSKARHAQVVVSSRVGCKGEKEKEKEKEREKAKVSSIAKHKGSQGNKMYKGK